MGEPFDPSAGHEHENGRLADSRLQFDSHKLNAQPPNGHMPFYSQFDHLPQPSTTSASQNGYAAFDMSAMNMALPHRGQNGSNVLSPGSIYHLQQALQFPPRRGPQFDARSLPQQQYPGVQMQIPGGQRLPNIATHAHGSMPGMDMYGYGMGGPQYSPVADPRFGGPGFPADMGMGNEYPQFARRPSEPAPVPAFPRGPPRKPKQSGHALWVGNLPPAATITDLKDHFSRDASKDIESLFLIAKSNCAFVNYRSEAACIAAMNRFHDSRFHGVRLVCRLRRGSTSSLTSPTALDAPPTPTTMQANSQVPNGVLEESDESPTIVGGARAEPMGEVASTNGVAPTETAQKVPEKFFVVKSLTVQDLEASVRNGSWATQSHNEKALNEAYDGAENVYLIFSANKSGEYFGYARMASQISGEPVKIESVGEREDVSTSGTPQSIPTPATETAPRGHIIDDSARGTIFWEADGADQESDSPVKENGGDNGDGQHWGRQFKIEWVSTNRLPFFRTRGLRNPWNANREVKIARDGTEIEPSVGRRLVAMFHRPPPPQNGVGPAGMSPHAGMPYR